jgi:integrase
MANISAVIVPAKALADGKQKVRLAVSHNGATRYIVTDIKIDSNQFKNGWIVRRDDAAYLNSKLRDLIVSYQKMIDAIPYVDSYSCSELVDSVKNGDSSTRMTLGELVHEYLKTTINLASKDSIKGEIAIVVDIIGSNKRLTSLNAATMNKMYISLSKKYRPNYIRLLLAHLSAAINFGIRLGYFRGENPLRSVKKCSPTIKDSWITLEQLKQIRDADLKSLTDRKRRDLFMLSFYLGGINHKDLMKINFGKCGDVLRYERSKTQHSSNTRIEFTIPDEAKPIIAKYITPSGKLNTIKMSASMSMKSIRNQLGIDNLCFYSARKTFAQLAITSGVQSTVIDYILGHTLNLNNMLMRYVYVTPEMATKALRKVLDLLK